MNCASGVAPLVHLPFFIAYQVSDDRRHQALPVQSPGNGSDNGPGNRYSTRGFIIYFMRKLRLGYGLLLASVLLSVLGYLSWSQGLITFLPGLLLIYVHKK